MEVTRDVINDLLPVYLAGEASADTRRLVEDFLRSDVEFASLVESQRSLDLLEQPLSLGPDEEKRSLNRLKRLIKTQTWCLAAALVFSLIPFSIRIEDDSITFFMLHTPKLATGYWVIAAVFWVAYFLTRRRLRVSGI